jgi:hypothetical protein
MAILVKVAQKLNRRAWMEEDFVMLSPSWPSTSQHDHFISHLSHTHLGGLFLVFIPSMYYKKLTFDTINW